LEKKRQGTKNQEEALGKKKAVAADSPVKKKGGEKVDFGRWTGGGKGVKLLKGRSRATKFSIRTVHRKKEHQDKTIGEKEGGRPL